MWLLRLPGSSSCSVSPWGWPCRSPQRWKWPGGWCSKCRPLVVVNMAGTEGFLLGVFKTFLWCPSVMVASGEFTIQGYLGQVMPPPILKICSAQCSCDFSNMVSMLVISAWLIKPMPERCPSVVDLPDQKKVYLVPCTWRLPSPGKQTSLRAAMLTFNLDSSCAIRAERHSSRLLWDASSMVLTFQHATSSIFFCTFRGGCILSLF